MKATFRILLMLGLMALGTWLVGCGSKKKTTQRERTKTESVVKETLSKKEVKDIKDSTYTNIGNTKLSIKTNQRIEATQADSSKTITITDARGNVTKIKGANVIISDLSELKQDNDTLTTSSVKSDDTTTETSETKDNKEKTESQKRNTDTDITRTGFVTQITIGFLIVGLLVLAYYKRSNILGWFS